MTQIVLLGVQLGSFFKFFYRMQKIITYFTINCIQVEYAMEAVKLGSICLGLRSQTEAVYKNKLIIRNN